MLLRKLPTQISTSLKGNLYYPSLGIDASWQFDPMFASQNSLDELQASLQYSFPILLTKVLLPKQNSGFHEPKDSQLREEAWGSMMTLDNTKVITQPMKISEFGWHYRSRIAGNGERDGIGTDPASAIIVQQEDLLCTLAQDCLTIYCIFH